MQTTMESSRPPLPLALLEPGRALAEISMLQFGKLPLRFAPSGDEHPVLVCPGFMASDRSTGVLRRFIKGKNYDVYPWTLGSNLGPGPVGRTMDSLERRVRAIRKQSGRRVSLIGWSLGGVLARELAKRIPDELRQVISLGSPISGDVNASNVSWLYEKVAGPIAAPEEIENYRRELQAPPLDVPSTAIFSRTDGIVHWRSCIEPEGPLTDNIEVYASHCGLGFNPFVFYAIADRLTMCKENWAPFDRGASAWRRLAFPSSGHIYS